MNSTDGELRKVVSRQASEWYVANQGGSLATEDRAAFVAWLRTSPLHVEEYLGTALVARDLRAAADDPAVLLQTLLDEARADSAAEVLPLQHSSTAPQRGRAAHWTPRRAVAALAAAGMVFAAAGLAWWISGTSALEPAVTYTTAHGEQGSWRLEDGTLLRLNTDSAVRVRYSRWERLVELDHGQANFDVAHKPNTRFRVTAGTAGAIATGTRFDVYRQRSSTIVTVAEGQVAVFTGKPTVPPWNARLPEHAQLVNAGYELRVDAGSTPAQPTPVDLSHSLAWLKHKIAFEHRPLGEVADEFNRYARIPLEIEDESLRALPVSGVFDAYDTDSFIAFLQTLKDVRVDRTSARIVVRRVTRTGQAAAAVED